MLKETIMSHNSKHVTHSHEAMVADFKRRFIVSTILTAPVLLLFPSIHKLIGYSIVFPGRNFLLWLLSTIIYVYGGYLFLKGLVGEVRRRLPGMMTLIGVAISVAYLYSSSVVFLIPGGMFFWELATPIDVMLLGHRIEMKTVAGAFKALELLAKSIPTVAHVIRNGKVVDVSVSKVKPGDKVLVDGVVVEGLSSVDEALVTGESKPVSKKPGDKVVAATVNLEGSLVIVAERTGKDTYIAQVVELVRRIQESKSKAQDLANRAAKWLTIVALSGGAITLALWSIVSAGFAFAFERAVTVMVITCPHALGLRIGGWMSWLGKVKLLFTFFSMENLLVW